MDVLIGPGWRAPRHYLGDALIGYPVVVGQVLRYKGFVMQDLAKAGQTVRGVIIALDDDKRIRRALAVSPTVDFYRYQVSFKLLKG